MLAWFFSMIWSNWHELCIRYHILNFYLTSFLMSIEIWMCSNNNLFHSLLAPKIDDQLLGRLDWAVSSASQIYNRWRALHNKFKFWTTFHGDYIRLDAMQPPLSRLPDTINLQQVFGVPKEPSDVGAGRIVVDRKLKLILIRCREDWAPFRAVTINKKPVMSPMDFANGYLYKRRNDEHFFVLKWNIVSRRFT